MSAFVHSDFFGDPRFFELLRRLGPNATGAIVAWLVNPSHAGRVEFFIADAEIAALRSSRAHEAIADALVAASLWHASEGGFEVVQVEGLVRLESAPASARAD